MTGNEMGVVARDELEVSAGDGFVGLPAVWACAQNGMAVKRRHILSSLVDNFIHHSRVHAMKADYGVTFT
jgi:hypothetical protein